MPGPTVQSLAKRYGVGTRVVEAYWEHCKEAIQPKDGQDGWGLVVNCVKAKLKNRKKRSK